MIFVVSLLLWNAILFLPFGGSGSAQLPYSEFVTQAERGNVAQVSFKAQTITGTLRQAIVWPQASAGASAAASPGPSGGQSDNPTSASYQTFTTTMPPTGDPELLPLLEQHGVTIEAADTSSSGSFLGSLLSMLLTSVLPAVLFIGFFYYLAKQAQRSQSGILGFGGSKARLYDAERPSVTFADVAGADEA